MTKDKLSKLIISTLYESLKTQKDKYGLDKIESIKELDPSKSYKYIDTIQKFIYNDNADKNEVKKYIDIYNDKLNKNLVDKDNRDINKFKTFNEFKKYVDSIAEVFSKTKIDSIKGILNNPFVKKQYYESIYTTQGEYRGIYNVYCPMSMDESIQIQGNDTAWCTQKHNKNNNYFDNYRFERNITIYYFVNKNGYKSSIIGKKSLNERNVNLMYQIQIEKNGNMEIRDNQDKLLSEEELYDLSGIQQSDYDWLPIKDGHYELNMFGKKQIRNYKNHELNGDFIEYNKDGKLSKIQHYKDGELHGEYIDYYDDGKIYKKIYYYSMSTFNYEEYYPNGQLKYKTKYVENFANGDYIEYYKNGQLKVKSNYIYGKPDGKYIEYYENSNIKIESIFKDKERNGNYTEYYPNGNIQIKQHYINDKYDGDYISYYENGAIMKQCKYNKGNGKCKYYDKQGKVMS